MRSFLRNYYITKKIMELTQVKYNDDDNGYNDDDDAFLKDFGDEDLNTTVGDIEVSAPPQATSSSGSKVASFVVPRGQTKLTLAEFYATTDSNRSGQEVLLPVIK